MEDLVVDMRNETGKVIFKAPEEGVNVCSHHSVDQLTVTICTSHCLHVGAEFMLYTYCYTNGKVVFLMCVALNGFHTKATYRWYKDAQLLEDENDPIVYVQSSGFYTCLVIAQDITEDRSFSVTSMRILSYYSATQLFYELHDGKIKIAIVH